MIWIKLWVITFAQQIMTGADCRVESETATTLVYECHWDGSQFEQMLFDARYDSATGRMYVDQKKRIANTVRAYLKSPHDFWCDKNGCKRL